MQCTLYKNHKHKNTCYLQLHSNSQLMISIRVEMRENQIGFGSKQTQDLMSSHKSTTADTATKEET